MILLVDDDRLELEVQKQMLISYGMNVDTATTGADAVALASEKEYSLVFIDTDMPEAEGLRAATKIKECQPGAPVIAISENCIQEEQFRVYRLDGQLMKPLHLDTLKEFLSSYVSVTENQKRPWRRRTDTLFDYEELVLCLGNDEYAVMRIIERFIDTHAGDCARVEQLIASEKYEEARTILNELYIMAGNIFCCRLYENAFILHSELAVGQCRRLPIFKEVWNDTIGKISEHCTELVKKYRKAEQEDADWEMIWSFFRTLCAEFDVETTEMFEKHHLLFAEHLDKETYALMEAAVKNYDYLSITRMLEAKNV